MSRSTAKKANEVEAQPQLIFDAKRDINPFWRSSLFSDVYLKNDVPREYKHLWENDEYGPFNNFYQGFVDLCIETEHESFDKWKEADTVKNWIVHVMDLLGWENNSERRSNSYMDNESFTVVENGRKQTFRPDLVYFDKPKHKSYTQKEKDFDRKLTEARNKRTGTQIVVEAKYWDRLSRMSELSKKDAKINDSASALGPELQTLKYMEIFDHDFGVLTDGKTWRLFHKDLSQGMDRRSFDFDLGNLRELALDLESYQNEEKFRHYAKYFYYFFSKESLIQTEKTKTAPFVHEVFEYSKKYAHSIEDDLKKRFIVSMGITCNSLMESCESSGEELNLETIRNVSESHLFNILFVKSCEVRRVLPISSTQYLRVSLHEVVETLDAMDFDPDKDWDDYLRDFKYTFGKKFDWDGSEIFNRVINLYEIIHDGTAKSKDFGFEVEGFRESVFSKDEWRFAKKHKIKNRDMVKIIFTLNFIEASFKGRKYQQIPYSYFTPRQLGSIYESFLEYRLEQAQADMIFQKGKWSKANLRSKQVRGLKLVDSHVVKKSGLFFSPNNKDRKMTGSYYTPDYIVKYIVKNTLEPLVENRTSSEILELKVCDPAMGSGHFLAGALDFLVESYRSKWGEENNDDVGESVEETSRKILDSCLYGVDLNPRAVKLANMSLWLMTSFAGKKLERLDDQLKYGNSLLTFQWRKEFKEVFSQNGFDAIVGNPPYIGQKGNKELFEPFKASNKWGGFYERKQDIYYYFIALSIDILKRDGFSCFITPPYFLTAEGAKNLRRHILENAKISSILDISDKVNVFDGVGISSIITSFKKCSLDEQKIQICRPVEDDITRLEYYDSKYCMLELDESEWHILQDSNEKSLSNRDFQNLGEIAKITPGIQTGADRVTKAHVEKFKLSDGVKKGDGIFVLSDSEMKNLNLSENEMSYIKPFFKNSEISRFYSGVMNSRWIINANKISNINSVPNIKKHLTKFREILDVRFRNFALKKADENGCWWYMYGYRPNTNFEDKKIILPYRSKENTFSLSESPFYSAMDIFFLEILEPNFSYEYILGILCSSTILDWLGRNCKKKGEIFELIQKPLSAIPIPIATKAEQKKIEQLVSKIIEYKIKNNTISSSLEDELNKAVESLYYGEEIVKAAA